LQGKLKEYIPVRQYLRKLHDSPHGLPLYENEALNLFMLGARGFGKSYMVGVGVVLHEIIFDGARIYNQESIDNPYQVEVFVGAALTSKSADILDKTKSALENLPGDWGKGEEYCPSPLYKEMSGSLRPNNMKNPWIHWYDKKIGGQWKKVGTKSNIKHGTFSIENPEAAAGTRPGVIVVEEVGLCPNILTVHGSNTACQLEGTVKFGSSVYLGTGGNMEKIVESETIFRDPKGFDFISFPDSEKPGMKTGWFVPAIFALNQFKDDNGNTDIEAALKKKLEDRKSKILSKDSSALDLEMMNYPLTPSEMFLSKIGNIFPIAYLQERLGEIEGDDKYLNAEYHGKLIINTETDKVDWKLDPSKKPIYSYPLKQEENKEGNLVIYNHPYEDGEGVIPYGRYLAGCDPYDHDEAGTTSLGSLIVYDKLQKEVVAEYTGRPSTAKQYYENVRRVLMYYNAKLLYENERKGIFDYFEGVNSLYLLQKQPELIKDVLQNSRVHGEELIKSWLIESYNDKADSAVLNLHKIRCIPLLKELIAYNNEGNFDRAMAFMMVIYFIQETRKQDIKKMQEVDKTDIMNSDFWNKPLFTKKKNFRL